VARALIVGLMMDFHAVILRTPQGRPDAPHRFCATRTLPSARVRVPAKGPKRCTSAAASDTMCAHCFEGLSGHARIRPFRRHTKPPRPQPALGAPVSRGMRNSSGADRPTSSPRTRAHRPTVERPGDMEQDRIPLEVAHVFALEVGCRTWFMGNPPYGGIPWPLHAVRDGDGFRRTSRRRRPWGR
jgi:hypothetical protein